jgi:hypothetical protein
MATHLVKPFPAALAALFGTLAGQAKAGAPVFAGTAGTIVVRKNQQGTEFYVRRFYAEDSIAKEQYIGLKPEADDKARELQGKIDEVKNTTASLRLLVREGFQAADSKTYVTLATLHLHGLFQAGATLVGSHAYGVILNQMGFRAPEPYATEDVDVARRAALAFDQVPEKSFLDILKESGIDFVEVPELDARKPSTSFKQRGMSRFHVDLLVPSPDMEIHNLPVPELKANASALPYLAYLLRNAQMSTLLAREGCCPVQVPLPERFALHKLVVSQLRSNRDAKSAKDVFQASAVIEALGESFPGALESAFEALPVSAHAHLLKALPMVRRQLGEGARGLEELQEAVDRLVKR